MQTSWINAYGETVTLTDAGDLRVSGRAPATNRVQPVRRAPPVESPYLAPKDPWAINDAQLKAVTDAVRDAENELQSAVNSGAPWVDVARLEQAVKSAKRDLTAAENQRVLEQRRRRVR